MKDLEKNNQTGLLRVTNHLRQGDVKAMRRCEAFERAIISYFRSRNEDNLKKPIPAINMSSMNTKSRISSYDVVRPSNTLPSNFRTSWTTDNTRPYDTNNNNNDQYTYLRDTRSGYHPNETNSFSVDTMNDSYYQPTSHGFYSPRYNDQNFRGQIISYDNGDGNENIYSPGEISF